MFVDLFFLLLLFSFALLCLFWICLCLLDSVIFGSPLFFTFFLFLLGSIWFFLLLFRYLLDSVLFGSISFFQNNPNTLWFYSVLPDSVQLDSIWFNFIFG